MPTDFEISPAAMRAGILGHSAAVIWLTGLSGAGKTTLARATELRLLRRRFLCTVVDGDVLRTGLSKGLGFTAVDRSENIRRAAECAVQLAQGGLIVIVALISPLREDRTAAANCVRSHGIPFGEVFVNAPLPVCESRDPKGLYRQARARVLTSFTGIDSPYEPPGEPDLELRTDIDSIEAATAALFGFALDLSSSRAFGGLAYQG